jgi:DNA repair exonuclease SbcCD ATPase subunit
MSRKRRQTPQPSTKDQRIAELELELVRERANNQRLQINNLRLQKLLERLQAEVEELRRAGKRQAAPFARRKRVEHPKKPGRKAGQGKFSRREKPAPEQVKETKVMELHGCPECGGSKLRNIHEHEQYMADIPVIVPIISLCDVQRLLCRLS